MSFMDKFEDRFGDDVLLHYGVKGMKWKEKKEKDKADVQLNKDINKTREGMFLKAKRVKQAERKGVVNKNLKEKTKQMTKRTKYDNSISGKIDKILKKTKDRIISKKRPKKRKVTITSTTKPMFSHSSLNDKKTIRHSDATNYRLSNFLEDTGMHDVLISKE